MEKSKVGTSRKDRDEARESDLQEETTFFNEQISILKLQTQIKELEARNKELEEENKEMKSTLQYLWQLEFLNSGQYGYAVRANTFKYVDKEIAEQTLNNPKQV